MHLTSHTINQYKASTLLSIDIETKDPELEEKGPGTHRGDGHICGLSICSKDTGSTLNHYLSLAHPDTKGEVIARNRKIAADILKVPNPKIGANIAYDIEWLNHEGFEVGGKFHDVQYAEPLLNEYARTYHLDGLATKYNVGVKKTNVLKEYADMMGWEGKPIKHIWRMPARVAAEYALSDTELPLDIFKKQMFHLEQQDLVSLYNLETALIPVLLRMRRNGARLDMPKFKRTIVAATEKQYKLSKELYSWAGTELNLNSTVQLAKIFDKHGIQYPRNAPTEKMKLAGKPGNPNLDKFALKKIAEKHPVCSTILEYKQVTTLINLFLSKYANFQVNGKLYGSFHPLRTDDYGTVSGRFSASKPNLQQVSAKDSDFDSEDSQLDDLHGQVVRSLFIPDDGYKWAKADYSQVEYRMLAHYAQGEGSKELVESYNANKHMDYHQKVMDITGLERRPAKTINFGSMYGMGVLATSKMLECPFEEAEMFVSRYHTAAPYVRKTLGAVSNVAASRGFIKTLLGRKARVHSSRKLYSMFNRLIQGSSADVMKKAMVDAEEKGLFDILPLYLTVHDELDIGFKENKEGEEALEELVHTMETTVKLDVPLFVDCHTGDNWAEAD